MKLNFASNKYSLVFFCFWALNFSFSQTGNTVKLSDKLSELERKFDVHFSYNHTFFDTLLINKNITCYSISNCLEVIQQKIPVTITSNDGKFFTIIPNRDTLIFKAIDVETNESAMSLQYQINNEAHKVVHEEQGIFTINNVFPLDSIHFYSNFYKTVRLQVKDLQKAKTIKLYKQQISLSQVLLKSYLTSGIDSRIRDHSLQINTEILGLLAGETDGDVFNVLNNAPGIHSPSGKSGNLNFRGSTYDQNLVQIDDIPIYHSGHFFGAISPYNASIISNIEVQRNMLPVKWGGRVGGLINMTTDTKIPEKNNYEVALNTIFAGATINTKLLKDKLSLLAAFRSSYPRFNTPKLTAISELIFQGSKLETVSDEINSSDDFDMGFLDMNAKLNYKINNKHSATLSFINIQNSLYAQVDSNDNSNQIDYRDLELDNWGITGKWKANFSEKWTTEVRLSKSKMNVYSESEGFVLEQRSSYQKYDNTIKDTRLITEAIYNHNNNLQFEGGYTLTEHTIISNELEEENEINTERKQNAVVHSNYFSLQKNWKEKLILTLGIHNNYYVPLKKLYVNPRILASYKLDNRWYLKSSFGTSNQFIQKKFTNDFDDFNITNQLWYLPKEDINPLKGTQAMVGGVFENSKWLFDLELYHKKTTDITNKTDNEQGKLTSNGGNLFVKRRWSNFETWVSYALSRTETDFNGVSTTAFYDQTHIVNLTGLLTLKQWKFAITWGYFSGMPIIYPDETDSNNANIDFRDRFDALHQLDFSASYTFKPASGIKSVLGLSILNVYNQDNIVNVFQNTSDNNFRKASRFSPNLQLNLFF
ncbi:TonB-dependent receptor plug domain-containing protein [Tamlana sp. 62-3]|uniref:TonB-dependent receptor plug domain-containing protein n=1 Tax=Neotamlana sargassicola TaxID=2883125 RepID=A0A9X1I5Z1_9FLAO|nr:TonB-dependent receptor plug domain-containing protein [Tamlana sargassicola]MCB4808470.1 TonB-dependent receptor plug domain-containing protein [Tamlana sargassicola]